MPIEVPIEVPIQVESEFLQNILDAGIVSLIFFLIVLALRFFMGFVLKRIEIRFSNYVTAVKFQDQVLVPTEDVQKYLSIVTKLIALVVYFPVVYFYVLNMFLIFPETKDFAQSLLSAVTTAMSGVFASVVDYLPNVVILILFFLVARTVIRVLQHFFKGIESKRIFINGFYPEWADPTQKITKLFVIIFFLVLAFPYLPGSDSPAFQGLSIFIGVLLSIGSSGAITNIISGIVLTYMRAFTVGDRVRIADTEGEVIEKSLFVTRIRTIKNVGISVPNSMVLNDHIINYSNQAKKRGLILNISLTLGYDLPWQQVQELLIEAVSEVEDVEKEPLPFVLQKALNDFYVEYEINVYTQKPEMMSKIYSDMNQRILDVFDNAGLEIASPHLRLLKNDQATNEPQPN